MPKYASYNPAAVAPQPVLAWYDTDNFTYPSLPPMWNLVAVTQAQWDAQAQGSWVVSGGAVIPAPVVAPVLTAAEQAAQTYAALISAGLTITSTSTPAVNGTYAVDSAAQANLNAIETYVLTNGNFELGTTQEWFLLNGSAVVIPSTAIFKEIASAIAVFVAQADIAQGTAAVGGTAMWPSASVTIP